MSVRKIAPLLVLGAALVFLCAAGSFVIQPGWQAETRLTNDPDTSTVGPNNGKWMATAPNGDLHVVWIDHRDRAIRVFHKVKSGGVWSADEAVTEKGGNPYRPVIAFDRFGNMHLVWNDDRTGTQQIHHKMWNVVWGQEIQVTSSVGDSFGPSIVTQGDTLHLVYMERVNGHLQVMYRYYFDLDWSPAYPLTDVATGDRMVPSLAKGRDDNLHAVWWDTRQDASGTNGKIYYRKRDGGVWLDEVCLTDPANNAMRPNIAVDDSLHVHVVWIDARSTYEQIYYRRWGPNGWEHEVAVTNEQATHYHPSIAAAGGDVFLAYWDTHLPGAFSEVYFKRRTSGAWTGKFQVSTGTGPTFFPCCIAEPNKNVHIGWVDGRDGNLEIYYREYVDPLSGVEGGGGDQPPAAKIQAALQAYPNPFRGSTTLELSVPGEASARIRVYSVDGRLVRTLLDARLPEGTHRIAWDGRDDRGRALAPGLYFAVGRLDKTRLSQKIILAK
jgi:hypothetical protein